MRTNAATLPGFSAETALAGASDPYRSAGWRSGPGGQVVVPQLFKWLRCAAAVTGAAATCSLTAVSGPVGLAACAAATAGAAAVCD